MNEVRLKPKSPGSSFAAAVREKRRQSLQGVADHDDEGASFKRAYAEGNFCRTVSAQSSTSSVEMCLNPKSPGSSFAAAVRGKRRQRLQGVADRKDEGASIKRAYAEGNFCRTVSAPSSTAPSARSSGTKSGSAGL
jgi:hypothetical protein